MKLSNFVIILKPRRKDQVLDKIVLEQSNHVFAYESIR